MCQEIQRATGIQIKVIDEIVFIFLLYKGFWVCSPRLDVFSHWQIELED
jgi:hypothetical protein